MNEHKWLSVAQFFLQDLAYRIHSLHVQCCDYDYLLLKFLRALIELISTESEQILAPSFQVVNQVLCENISGA